MSKVYLIADLHFGHEKMAKKRGFTSIEEHDNTIINNWNNVIHKRDIVWLLGDITMEKAAPYGLLDKLNGNIRVILGNHDKHNTVRTLLNHVDSVAGAVKYKGFILTHIPIHPDEAKRFKGNIHGHVHENTINNTGYINVSCEALNYTPIEFNNLINNHYGKKRIQKGLFKRFCEKILLGWRN